MQPRKRGLRPKEVTGVGPGPEGTGARTQAGTALRAPEERAGHKPGPQPVPPELRGACVRPLCRRRGQGRGQPSLCSFLRERPPSTLGRVRNTGSGDPTPTLPNSQVQGLDRLHPAPPEGFKPAPSPAQLQLQVRGWVWGLSGASAPSPEPGPGLCGRHLCCKLRLRETQRGTGLLRAQTVRASGSWRREDQAGWAHHSGGGAAGQGATVSNCTGQGVGPRGGFPAHHVALEGGTRPVLQ